MADPKYLKDLKALSRIAPAFQDLEAIERELYVSGSDRATAVLFSTYLESHLGDLILSRLRPDLTADEKGNLLGFEGPIGSFSSRIQMGYALDLFGKIVQADLNLVRHIRNQFAHARMPIHFKTPEIAAACAHLKIVDLGNSTIPYGYLNRVSHGELSAATDKTEPKTRFISTCHNISYRMLVAKRGYPQAGDPVFAEGTPLP